MLIGKEPMAFALGGRVVALDGLFKTTSKNAFEQGHYSPIAEYRNAGAEHLALP